MVQRNALILAAAITAFVLVLAGGVAAGLALAATPPASAALPAPAALPPVPAAGAAPATQGYPVSADQAQSIALQAAPGATLLRAPELVSFQGVAAYEVTLDRGLLYVDATTGSVLFNGAVAAQAQPQTGAVTAEQAAEIARAYLGGGSVRDVQAAEDDGQSFYVVRFDDGTLVAVSGSGQVLGARAAGEREHEEHEQHENEWEGGHDG